ncbi:MAG: exopolyphosphatase [Nocardioidaceae bacterium]
MPGGSDPAVGAGRERVAAIDCGTNSIRLLVADLDPASGTQRDLDRRLRIVRLGEGVDSTGRIADAALERTYVACAEYAAAIADLGAPPLRFCATSAARDARNAGDFVAGVHERLGVRPEVIDGAEEARLTAHGATRSLVGLTGPSGGPLAAPMLVVDIGGGSTELVSTGIGGPEVLALVSLDVGSVRLTERHLLDDPPTARQVARARADVDAALDGAGTVRLAGVRTVIGVGGTATTVAAATLRLDHYDSTAIHRAQLPLEQVVSSCESLLHMRVAQRRELPFMHPGRADVIGGGALVLERVLRRLASTLADDRVVVSEHDILDGIAWSMVAP